MSLSLQLRQHGRKMDFAAVVRAVKGQRKAWRRISPGRVGLCGQYRNTPVKYVKTFQVGHDSCVAFHLESLYKAQLPG